MGSVNDLGKKYIEWFERFSYCDEAGNKFFYIDKTGKKHYQIDSIEDLAVELK